MATDIGFITPDLVMCKIISLTVRVAVCTINNSLFLITTVHKSHTIGACGPVDRVLDSRSDKVWGSIPTAGHA